VESAHFDWHWRERPALALLAWEAGSRSSQSVRRTQVESIEIKLGRRGERTGLGGPDCKTARSVFRRLEPAVLVREIWLTAPAAFTL